MSKIPNNRKYVELENVRIYHNKKSDTIQIISNDRDLYGKPFQLTLKQGTPSESTLRELLINNEVISTEEQPEYGLSKMAPYPIENSSRFKKDWEKIEVGIKSENTSFTLDLNSPNMNSSPGVLITGKIGSGRTVVERNFMLHMLQNHNHYRIFAIDSSGTNENMKYLYSHHNVKGFVGSARTSEDTLTILRFLDQTIQQREQEIEEKGFANFAELEKAYNESDEPITRIVLFISDLYELTRKKFKPSKSNQPIEDEGQKEIIILLESLLNRGKRVGMFVIASASTADSISSEIINCFSTRVLMNGSEKETGYANRNDSEVKGRAVVRVADSDNVLIQAYYSSQEHFSEVILQQEDE